jgi:hypothetical protein
MPYTEEELAALSQTERDALTATEDDDDATLADIAGDDDDDSGDDDSSDDDKGGDDDSDDKGGDTKGADDKSGDDDKGADDKGGDDNVADDFDLDDVPAVAFAPKLSGEVLPVYQADIDKVTVAKQAEIDALEDKLDEGELDKAAYRAQRNAIEASLKTEIRKLEAASQNDEIAGQLWQAEQAAFFKANPDYTQAKNPAEWDKLNKEVIKVASDPANAKLTGIQTLCLAKHNLSEAVAFAEFKAARALQKAGKTPADDKSGIPKKPAAKRPDQQTLRDVPAADAADIGQDKFAHLDKLSGVRLEAAIAKMTPEEQEAYLMGA